MIRKYINIIFLIVIAVVSLLLIVEYYQFRKQLNDVFLLKKQYSSYCKIFKEFLDKCKSECSCSENGTVNCENGFPDGVRVYSSDESNCSMCYPFIVVNRDDEYLKSSAISYLQQWSDQSITSLDDTGVVVVCDEPEKKSQKPVKKVLARKKSKPTSLSVKQLAGFLRKKRVRKKDIDLIWPIKLDSFWISSLFGRRKKANGTLGYHYGIDMAALSGTPVKAVASGVVTEANFNSGYGKTIVVTHNKKYKTRYAHLSYIKVKTGQRVSRGQLIGKVGNTGLVRKSGKDASHLHFEVYSNGRHVNPLAFLI